jgi:hypothetical protein
MALTCRWRSRPQHHVRTHAPQQIRARVAMIYRACARPTFATRAWAKGARHPHSHFLRLVPPLAFLSIIEITMPHDRATVLLLWLALSYHRGSHWRSWRNGCEWESLPPTPVPTPPTRSSPCGRLREIAGNCVYELVLKLKTTDCAVCLWLNPVTFRASTLSGVSLRLSSARAQAVACVRRSALLVRRRHPSHTRRSASERFVSRYD